MHDIKRNDPCTCGSGKKYKKCCASKGSDNAIQAILEREVVSVQSELLRHAFSYTEFSYAVQKNKSKYNPPESMKESFCFFVGVWTLFTSKVLSGKTALEQFCVSYILNLRPVVQEIVRSWIGKTPSVVKVVGIEGRDLVVHDIFSKELKDIKIIDELMEIPKQGALLVGYIVPFTADVSTFFTSVLSFEDEMADKVEQFLCWKFTDSAAEASAASEFLQERFLDLVDLFMSDRELDSVEAEPHACVSAQAAAVVNLLEEKVQSEDMPESVIKAGSTLWQKYYHKKQPLIKNEKIYAAALHYLLVDKVFPVYRRTQKATAELYDASIASVSSRSREMAFVLEEELKELCVK
ncbi:MAG TPA: hypothetical protein GX497_13630 [Bacillus bacterium]|nr:hypothetical protein [Bacillus sp. (in: firmicutes)]